MHPGAFAKPYERKTLGSVHVPVYPTLDEAVEAGSWLCGTSEDVIETFKAIEEKYPGVERVNIAAVMGMPLEVFKDQLSIISEEVMPSFKG